MLVAQLLAGLAAAVIVPSLVALIAHHYRGQQQATAVGTLGSARAGAGVAAFLIGGMLGTFVGWRPVFGLLIALSGIVFLLSFKLKPAQARPEVRIDVVGVILAAASIILISFGFNNLNRWGLGCSGAWRALRHPGHVAGAADDRGRDRPASDLHCLDQTAAGGWQYSADRSQHHPSSEERAAIYTMFAVVALEAMLNFSVPLYIQIIQGRSPIETAIAMLPFNLTVFFTAMLVVRLYTSTRQADRPGRLRDLHRGPALARLGRA